MTLRVAILGHPHSIQRGLRRFVNSGGTLYVMYVNHPAFFDQYHRDLLDVKRLIAVLNSLHESGGISFDDYCKQVRERWINGVAKDFVVRYGMHYIPYDIRIAIDNVSAELNEYIIEEQWPEIEYVDVDVRNMNHLHIVIHNL